MGRVQRGGGGGYFGINAEGRGIKALSGPRNSARTVEVVAVKNPERVFGASPKDLLRLDKFARRLNGCFRLRQLGFF
jgi:hypothetical protein